MKVLLLAAVAVVALAGPAFACIGTTEYPETAEALQQSTLTPERKAEIEKALQEGWAMHSQSHETSDGAMMGESIEILRGLQSEIK
ncbi:MAG: hypothetical protein OEM59_06315 [Rhodospirillales bacterium]|nr:hypothetical protein [Rhodospirillales bacterium]